MVEGKIENEEGVIHVIVGHCYNLTSLLGDLTAPNEQPLAETLSRADEKDGSVFPTRKVVQGYVFPAGRNFK
jgi:error-prone DNA polymerase